jgi:hypothetical protein
VPEKPEEPESADVAAVGVDMWKEWLKSIAISLTVPLVAYSLYFILKMLGHMRDWLDLAILWPILAIVLIIMSYDITTDWEKYDVELVKDFIKILAFAHFGAAFVVALLAWFFPR